jgi:outer membrane murein-binding lipoprotein Lpp
MEFKPFSFLLVAVFLVAILVAGCTTTTTTGTPSPAQTPSAAAATIAANVPATAAPVVSAAPVVVSTPPQCPDKNVWDGKWDTRWVSESHDIAPDPNYPGFPWSGQDSPGATPVVLTQKCWDITGTYIPGGATMGSGTITAKIEGDQLKGNYKTVWTSGSTNDEYGTFTLTMAEDNQSWVGYAKSHDRGDYQDPNNWVGRKG